MKTRKHPIYWKYRQCAIWDAGTQQITCNYPYGGQDEDYLKWSKINDPASMGRGAIWAGCGHIQPNPG